MHVMVSTPLMAAGVIKWGLNQEDRYGQDSQKKPFYFAGAPLVAIGAAFAAIGASGQEAFGYTAVGLLVPGLLLLSAGYRSNRQRV
ncbi:hypothetical protein [Pseudomonas sp. CAM1A]|uniref:hypothetical protein n=1 Tax=Pseudomonas sp. CAM1A TaxID=3231717 RepID=UPI0039C6B4B8